MAKLKVSLSIGYPTAGHEDIIDIDDDELNDCETEEETEKLINDYVMGWAWNYIDIGAELIEENK